VRNKNAFSNLINGDLNEESLAVLFVEEARRSCGLFSSKSRVTDINIGK
jgi:hypothetical protein